MTTSSPRTALDKNKRLFLPVMGMVLGALVSAIILYVYLVFDSITDPNTTLSFDAFIGSLVFAFFVMVLYVIQVALLGAVVGGIIGTFYIFRRPPRSGAEGVTVGIVIGGILLALGYLIGRSGGEGLHWLRTLNQPFLITFALAGCVLVSLLLNRSIRNT